MYLATLYYLQTRHNIGLFGDKLDYFPINYFDGII